jgi:Fe-S-cluster-containing dehydrogenase component
MCNHDYVEVAPNLKQCRHCGYCVNAAPLGHAFRYDLTNAVHLCAICGFSVSDRNYQSGSYPVAPCGPGAYKRQQRPDEAEKVATAATTPKACTCPLHGPDGLMARGCSCGAIQR